ncbi:MAG: succinate dehydrogenase/fumarate reductase iron-sulfur subunit [Lautropia sp.]|nr:succinate dehydrogenase/fumarate reductase iron-sulfur subunit [Lautropia sp.]
MSSQETRTITIECLRFNPDTDREPRYQRYDVPFTHDMSVLEGLQYIKDHLDGSLTFRWSCRMAVCGSCGKMANGIPVLSCQTFLRDFYPDVLRVEPLEHFPIVRDLAVDQSDFLYKLERVKPYIIPKTPQTPADGPNRQTPRQMEAYYQFSQCINCLLCYAACPQYGLNDEFTGPAALALLQRYNADSRDHGKAERMPVINAESGVWGCTLVGECSAVCPKGVDPAHAININKINSTENFFFRFLQKKPRQEEQTS